MSSTVQTKNSLTSGPIIKPLLMFMIPLMISNIFQSLYNAVDTMVVGHYLGDQSLAAIGACSSIFDMMVGFALGIGSGISIVAGRSYGAGKPDLVKKTVVCALIIGLSVSLLITILGSAFIKPILRLLNTPEEVLAESYSYISIMLMFIVVMFAYNMCTGLLRAIGNSVVPLIFLMISSVLNVVLDITFIGYLDMGVCGAAIATVIAQGFSALLCLIYIFKKTPLLVPKKEHFKVDRPLFLESLAQGLSSAFMSCFVALGTVVLQSGINSLGTHTIAGHTTARKIYMLCNMPIASMALAMGTFVSQNKGADKRDRILKAIRFCYMYDFIVASVITLILWTFGPALVRLISGSSDPTVVGNATRYLRVVGPFYFVLGLLNQTKLSLQGIGQKILPMVSSVIELIGKSIFVALLIPVFGYNAVIWCEPIIWCVMATQLLISFFMNPYIRNKLLPKAADAAKG